MQRGAKGVAPACSSLGQRLSQPAHGAIDVVQIHVFGPGDGEAILPVQHARTIAAGDEQAMQDGEKENPLQGDLEASTGQQPLDDLRDLQLLPQPPEDQRRPDAAVADGRRLARGDARRAPSRPGRTWLPIAAGRRAGRFAAADRAGPRWRRRVVCYGPSPSGSRRFAGRRALRIASGGRTWRPPCGIVLPP